MKTQELTIQLPIDEIKFIIKQYAKRHRVTVSELVNRYANELQQQKQDIHPDIQKFSGIIPKDIDAQQIYYQHILEKHS